MESIERYLTFKEIGEKLGSTPDWVRRAWKRGEFGQRYIDTSKHCSGYEIRIPESAVLQYVARRTFNLPPAVVATEPQTIKAVG